VILEYLAVATVSVLNRIQKSKITTKKFPADGDGGGPHVGGDFDWSEEKQGLILSRYVWLPLQN
jgi:hypothetical protein